MLGRITAKLRVDGSRLKQNAQRRKAQARPYRARPETTYVDDFEILMEIVDWRPTGVLYLVHVVLGEPGGMTYPKGAVEELTAHLDNGGCEWRVASNGLGLTRHVSEPVAALLDAALDTSPPSAAEHLTAAWRSANALAPDPSRAYTEAIKAVEATIIPIVAPRHSLATLGTVISNLEQQGHTRWWFAIPAPRPEQSLATLVSMLRLLWQGQTDRHAGPGPTIPPSPESAKAAVQLAVTLVRWLADGALRRR
jgi:hypothetical protein